MPKNVKDEWRTKAIELRRQGFSYAEIRDHVPLAKSSLSILLRNTVLSKKQTRVLKLRRSKIARENIQNKINKIHRRTSIIDNTSINSIRTISRRELWFMGIMLCWHERLSRGDVATIQRGIQFASVDKNLIKLFMRWLSEVGHISKNELAFDIFLKERSSKFTHKAIIHWMQVTGCSKKSFSHIYKQNGSGHDRVTFGILRIRVRASSMLARQISGWMKGILKYYKLDSY